MRANGPRQSREPPTWQGEAVPAPPLHPPQQTRLEAGRLAGVSASDSRKRSPLVVQLAPDERATVSAAARAVGLSLSGYARETLLGAPTPRTQRAAPPPDVQALAILLGQLGKVGANLNQLARLGNQGQPVPLAEVMETLAAVRAAAEKVRQALA